ncbi:MAG: 2-oxoacid:acceptor oxidoreductase family protein [Candidatus Aminicenantes bacterium]
MNIRFSGFGGQGIVMAGYIMGCAAVLDGKNSLQTQSYGSASRGGACKSDVIISDDEIYELEFSRTDILVVMSQPAYAMYIKTLNKQGLLFIDPDLVKPDQKHDRLHSIKATETAYKKFGSKIVGNMVMLGLVTAIAEPASKKSMQESIRQRVPKGTEKLNLDAFEEGYRQGAKEKGRA